MLDKIVRICIMSHMKAAFIILCVAAMACFAPADVVSDLRPVIRESAAANGVDPIMMEAIIRHESAHATSHAARTRNNLAGIMGRRGQRKYVSKEECVRDLGRILGRYKARGRVTTAQIGRTYCTTGGWSRYVNQHMNSIRAGKYGALEEEKSTPR